MQAPTQFPRQLSTDTETISLLLACEGGSEYSGTFQEGWVRSKKTDFAEASKKTGAVAEGRFSLFWTVTLEPSQIVGRKFWFPTFAFRSRERRTLRERMRRFVWLLGYLVQTLTS